MTESKELLAAQAEPLTELPLEGFYGGKPKRFTIEYDDLSSRCIGNADGSVDNIVRNLLAHSTTDPRTQELEEQLRRYEEALEYAYLHYPSPPYKHPDIAKGRKLIFDALALTNNQHEATNDQ